MPIVFVVVLALIVLVFAYLTYGQWLSRTLNLRHDAKTPAHQFKNDIDFLPANKYYLLSQHLSAIAAAGPIVGPILAGMWFGWLPTFLWIIFGGIFIGGVHDMVTIVASIRHEGRSIAEVIKDTMGRRAFIVFLLFLWFSLIYIIAAFTDVTAGTFAEPTRGAQIASSSMLYLVLALVMGIIVRIFNPSLTLSTLIFIPLVFVCIYLGPIFPLHLPSIFGLDLKMSWNVTLLFYCFFAAIIPVWLLLQPRGYLGGFFLTLTAGASFLGLVIGSFAQKYMIQAPAFVSFNNAQGFPLIPILFTTVACGACSGFHCLIASGTTSKQLSKETDALPVGYGSMLLESFVAVMALGTLLLLTTDQSKALGSPDQIFASGVATFLNSFGIHKEFALNFALLAFATFVYDTLDVATRLGRYIFEELTGWKNKLSPYIATFATLILPLLFLTRKITDANGNVIPGWKLFWTVFGSSNQLLAALVLFGLSLWLYKGRMKYKYVLLPSIFMIFVAVLSLLFILKPWVVKLLSGQLSLDPVGLTCLVLILLTAFLITEGIKIFLSKSPKS
jgi:carbon starvation protein